MAAFNWATLGSIVMLGGGVVGYSYKYHYDFIKTYYKERKERLYMFMNQGTMVVSQMGVCGCEK